MKYVITGSTGHISRPITEQLTKAKHSVTVITSKNSKIQEITDSGAEPAVGRVEDKDFLIRTFAGADAVYLMIPPDYSAKDWVNEVRAIADNYIAAIEANHVKYVVILSATGAHYGKNMGPVDGYAYLEKESQKLTGSNVYILRPVSFHYNLFGQIPMIKNAGFTGSTQPADFIMPIVHTDDIADIAAALLLKHSFSGKQNIEYIATDDSHTWAEITSLLGAAVNKPELQFVELTDEQYHNGLLGAGLSEIIADGLVEMGRAQREGKALEDYWLNRPRKPGKRSLEDIVKAFKMAYGESNS